MKTCRRCARPLPAHARVDAKYCSSTCRSARWHRRKRTDRALANRRKCATCRKSLALGLRWDVQYCSARCRQRAYRQRQAAMPPRKAHQRVIREQLATSASAATVDIGRAEIRPITLAGAKALIETYEWLGKMPAVSRYAFGIYFDAGTKDIVRYPYRSGDMKPSGAPETVVSDLAVGGGHWTRDVAFSPDGKTMYVAVGSSGNVAANMGRSLTSYPIRRATLSAPLGTRKSGAPTFQPSRQGDAARNVPRGGVTWKTRWHGW